MFAPIQPGASLVLAFSPTPSSRTTALVIGGSRLAAARSLACLDAGYRVVLACHSTEHADAEVRWRLAQGQVDFRPLPDGSTSWKAWLQGLPAFEDVGLACLADTSLLASSPNSVHALRQACFSLRLPLNVADHPSLSDFSFPATYRWPSPSSAASSPLQLAISTSASSCRLAVRLRREIVSKVSKRAGEACEAIGELRKRARQVADDELGLSEPVRKCPRSRPDRADGAEPEIDLIAGGGGSHSLNRPVDQLGSLPPTPPLTPPLSADEPASPISPEATAALLQSCSAAELAKVAAATRMRWIAQISEYWSIDRIASLLSSKSDMDRVLQVFPGQATSPSSAPPSHPTGPTSSDPLADPAASARHDFTITPLAAPSKRGRILLVGSGPGHPSLLTLAAHTALTKTATVVLSDKLVPAEVLALVPDSTELFIAKKYPGNAEGAQNELMGMAVEAARRGETVVRLKQGDPYLYGRGGEEVLYFRTQGFECTVIPGVSSALAAPLMAGIPVTQRGASESVLVCTGVGRGGKSVSLPAYERGRTLVVLMGVARIAAVVEALTKHARGAYPTKLPIGVVERASSPDQRLVASTLDGIVEALDRAGEQRPPGMMVIGWSVLSLEGEGDVTALDGVKGMTDEERDAADDKRIAKWLGDRKWIVKEGLGEEWAGFLEDAQP